MLLLCLRRSRLNRYLVCVYSLVSIYTIIDWYALQNIYLARRGRCGFINTDKEPDFGNLRDGAETKSLVLTFLPTVDTPRLT